MSDSRKIGTAESQVGCLSWLKTSLLKERVTGYNKFGYHKFSINSARNLKVCQEISQAPVPLVAADCGTDSNVAVVVVVDPFSSGRYLVSELLKRGERLVAVQSSPSLPPFLSAALLPDREALRMGQSGRFMAIFDHIDDDGDLDNGAELRTPDERKDAFDIEFVTDSAYATLKSIRNAGFHVRAVVAGSEPGVELAEQLQAALGFSERNSVRTSLLRRDKYPMQEALRKVNLRAIKQKFANSPEEVFNWMNEAGLQFPIILKPAMGAGTEGVCKCGTFDDVTHAFVCTSGKKNVCGVQNTGLIAQEFLQGPEYVVDSISCGKGQHAVLAICKYQKLPDLTYEYTKVIESTGKIQDSLRDYIVKVLDALGIHFGASHAEVIMTTDGPCLVEVGARMHGFLGPEVIQEATGFGIHEFLADLTMGGEAVNRVRDLVNKDYRYKLVKHAYDGKLNNRPEWRLTGTIQEEIGAILPGIEKEMALSGESSVAQAELNFVNLYPSAIRHFHATVHKGDQLPITIDALTSPGVFVVVHESEQECEAAMQAVRKAERAILERAIGIQGGAAQ